MRPRLTIAPAAPTPVPDLREFMFQVLLASNRLADGVLAADRKAVAGREFYDDAYFEAFAKEQFPRAREEAQRRHHRRGLDDHRRLGGRRTAAASARPAALAPSRPQAEAARLGTPPAVAASPNTMDVYLIPTTTSGRYELYYEAPEKTWWTTRTTTGGLLNRLTFGLADRLKRRFSAMLLEAEEWRHRRHEAQPEAAGLFVRLRRKVMGFIVERIAEQRLLWHLRKVDEVCARIPADIVAGRCRRDHPRDARRRTPIAIASGC